MGTPTPPDAEPPPSREQFIQEVTDALRAAGLGDGAFDYEPLLGTLVHTGGIGLDVHSLYDNLGSTRRDVRLPTLASVARALVAQEELPARWDDAKQRVLPDVKPRIQLAIDQSTRSPHEDAAPRATADITPHLVFEVAIPVEGGSLRISGEMYETWGVTAQDVFQQAAVNLDQRSSEPWTTSADAPGVYGSPWSDGFDTSRVMLPRLFGRVPLKGWPVAILPTPSQLYFAGSDDEEGLFNLGLTGQRVFGREQRFGSLRPIRMGADGESWEDWLPAPGHPAYQQLRLLRIIEEMRDNDAQAHLHQKLSPPRDDFEPLPSLRLLQSQTADNVTVTVWKAGEPRPLPMADVIIFVRDEAILGYAAWEDVHAALPDEFEALPTYPKRYLGREFPEDWKLSQIGLQSWDGPLP